MLLGQGDREGEEGMCSPSTDCIRGLGRSHFGEVGKSLLGEAPYCRSFMGLPHPHAFTSPLPLRQDHARLERSARPVPQPARVAEGSVKTAVSPTPVGMVRALVSRFEREPLPFSRPSRCENGLVYSTADALATCQFAISVKSHWPPWIDVPARFLPLLVSAFAFITAPLLPPVAEWPRAICREQAGRRDMLQAPAVVCCCGFVVVVLFCRI